MAAQIVFGTVAEDDYVTMLFMLFEGIPDTLFFTQTVDKVEVAFEILGDILAYSVVAALLKTESTPEKPWCLKTAATMSGTVWCWNSREVWKCFKAAKRGSKTKR